MSKSIKVNFLYNLFFQIITLFIPLLTTPYISRVLGRNGIGINSWTLGTAQMFILAGTLGITMYGNRQIAYVRNDKEKMSKTFWSIVCLNLITTSIAFLIYILIYVFFSKDKNIYLIIQSINIISAMIDISWLYMGLEDFKKTVTRNLVVKIIGIICIFVFVKVETDLYKYILINGCMVLFGNLVMWMYLPQTVLRVKIKLSDIIEHLSPTIKLFIPQVATQIYLVLDRVMLGHLTTNGDTGDYDQSQKIVKLVLGLVTSLGIVMLPRMSNTFASGDKKKMDEYLNVSLQGVSYASIPMTIGLGAISFEFVPWFFGKDYQQVALLIAISCPILFFIAISNVLGMQYLVPSNRHREFTASLLAGATINLILNLLLITRYKAFGTCISTLVAEFLVTFFQYMAIRRHIDIKTLLNSVVKYFGASILMAIVVRIIGVKMGPEIITTIIQVIVGVVVYIMTLVLLREKINILVIETALKKLKIKKINYNN